MTTLADRGKAAPKARPFPDLSRLIHPIDPETFEREYWERQPLLVHRDDPEYFADLLTLDDVDQALTLSGTKLDMLRVVVDGKETAVSALNASYGHNSLEALYEHYRNGSTVTLNALEQRWEPLQVFARRLSAELNARIQLNVYVTPAGNRGFVPHYDMHDVFIAQVHGTKHWRLASQPYALPLDGQPYDKSQPEPPPEEEFDLRAGDLLYLPRGAIHSGTSNDTVSVHITIGIHPMLCSQAIEQAVRKVFTQDVRFRRGLPMGFAGDPARQLAARDALAELVDELHARLSPQDMVAASLKRAASMALPTLRHHLTDLEHLDHLGLDTRVRRRVGLRFNLTVDDEKVWLDFHHKTIQLPASVADEVRYVASSDGDGCTAASIPGDLDDDGRIVLIRTLLREGFLTRA